MVKYIGKNTKRVWFLWIFATIVTIVFSVVAVIFYKYNVTIVDYLSMTLGIFAFFWTQFDSYDKDREAATSKGIKN